MTLLWKLINVLKCADFKVCYVCMDGASTNRSLVRHICGTTSTIGRNITTLSSNLCFIMDFSHVVKKIRNSLYTSSLQTGSKRQMLTPKGPIYWDHFRDAYIWDKRTHFLRLHRKLTEDHFHLTTSLKMRNHLAEQVLNKDMLYLLQQYQKTLPNPDSLNDTLLLVETTSKFISTYRSSQPIQSVQDERLIILSSVQSFFVDWHEFVLKQGSNAKECKKMFMTDETFFDLKSCIEGFIALCHQEIDSHPITPKLINSDIVENVFCMQRAIYGGANTNPDANQYRYIMTSLIIAAKVTH